jgi:peroxin-1
LHPLLRLDLGLTLDGDYIQLVLVDLSEIEESPVEELSLEPIKIDEGGLFSSPWLKPDCVGDTSPTFLSQGLSPRQRTDKDNVVLKIGSIVSSSWCNISTLGPPHFFRLLAAHSGKMRGNNAVKAIAILTMQGLQNLCEQALSGKSQSGQKNPVDFARIQTSITDASINLVPQRQGYILESIESTWIEKVLHLLSDRNGNKIFLKHGPLGIGKTHLCLSLASFARIQHNWTTLYLDCRRIRESLLNLNGILEELQKIFQFARGLNKALIILDDLDCLAPNVYRDQVEHLEASAQAHGLNPSVMDQSKIIADRIVHLFENSVCCSAGDISLLVTCTDEYSIQDSIRRHKDCSSCDAVRELSRKNRFELLKNVFQRSSLNEWEESEVLDVLQAASEGFRPRDIVDLSALIRQKVYSGQCSTISQEVLVKVFRDFTPLSRIAVNRQSTSARVDWSEIGGLFHVKSVLNASIVQPSKYSLLYSSGKVRLPKGVLLFGPSGCGKSLIVPALAKKCNLPLVTCKGPELLDRYIGASEAKVRDLFVQAASVAPSILFLDELDALAPRRGSDHTGVTDRVVNQLLTFLDGVEESGNGTIFVIGCTSRPDKIDPALLRPGRLEQHLFVGPPSDDVEYADVFSKICIKWNIKKEDRKVVASSDFLKEVFHEAPHAREFSPADIKAVMDSAQIRAVHRVLDRVDQEENVFISTSDIKQAIHSSRPSLSDSPSCNPSSSYLTPDLLTALY